MCVTRKHEIIVPIFRIQLGMISFVYARGLEHSFFAARNRTYYAYYIVVRLSVIIDLLQFRNKIILIKPLGGKHCLLQTVTGHSIVCHAYSVVLIPVILLIHNPIVNFFIYVGVQHSHDFISPIFVFVIAIAELCPVLVRKSFAYYIVIRGYGLRSTVLRRITVGFKTFKHVVGNNYFVITLRIFAVESKTVIRYETFVELDYSVKG